jgi:hypothetical protein
MGQRSQDTSERAGGRGSERRLSVYRLQHRRGGGLRRVFVEGEALPGCCPTLPAGIAYSWLDELLFDPRLTLESLASREGKSERSIRMTLSLALLAPNIVKAAIDGRLPRDFGLKCLVDPPMAWPDQYHWPPR